MSTAKQYAQELRNDTNYSPTWLPIVKVAPGDVGRIANFQYEHVAPLGDYGIEYTIEDGSFPGDFTYSSKNAVSKQVKLAGQAPAAGSLFAAADAGVSLHFSRTDAVVFEALGCRSSRIRNVQVLGEKILALYKAGHWDEDLVVVTEVITAASATILFSSASDAGIDLFARGKVQAATFNLADADAKLEIHSERNIGWRTVATAGMTPLFRAAGVKKRLLRPDVFRDHSFAASPEAAVFGEVDYEDFAPAAPAD
ncbi:MAG: hypothetical protein M3O15_01800 [Acidobacteriota bacterium]|nr:hypothetical protein [Acidobacteriota bacterium]